MVTPHDVDEREDRLYRNCVPVHQPKDGMSGNRDVPRIDMREVGTNEGGQACELFLITAQLKDNSNSAQTIDLSKVCL